MQGYLQLEAFKRKEGTFSKFMAFKTANNMPAYQWWGANIDEEEGHELKRVAKKVYVCCQIQVIYVNVKHGNAE